jgi:hypothetical protein
MFESKLFEYKKIRLAGVTFVIQKLSPQMLLNKENIFPISPYFEEIKNGKPVRESELQKKLEEQKERIKNLILLSVVEVQHWFKKKNIQDLIDGIMERENLYSALLTFIVQYSLGQKKNSFKLFPSIESLHPLFTN